MGELLKNLFIVRDVVSDIAFVGVLSAFYEIVPPGEVELYAAHIAAIVELVVYLHQSCQISHNKKNLHTQFCENHGIDFEIWWKILSFNLASLTSSRT